MGIQLADQTLIFFQSCLVGAALTLLYDVFRISRIAVPTPAPVIFVEDLLFFLACAAVTFLFMLQAIDGQVRFFLLAGEIIGGVLYWFTLGQLVMKVSEAIIRVVRAILGFLCRWILYPICRLIYRITSIIFLPFEFLWQIAKKLGRKGKLCLKVRGIVLYNQCKGFLNKKKRTGRVEAEDEADREEAF